MTRATAFMFAVAVGLVVGFLSTKPSYPSRSVAFFATYDGGWFCLTTVERAAR